MISSKMIEENCSIVRITKTGSSSFPTRGDKNKTLGKWITTQRKNYRIKKLDEIKIKKLNEIGFIWRVSKAGAKRKLGSE